MKNFNKSLVVRGIIAVIILLLIGMGAYYADRKSKQESLDKMVQELMDRDSPEFKAEKSKSFSSAENWKTYTDDSFGFSFKYHPGLSVSKTDLQYKGRIFYSLNVDDTELAYPSYKMDEVIDMGLLVLPEETLEDFIKETKDKGAKILKQEAGTLGGVPATKLTVVGEIVGTDQETNYIFARKNGVSFVVGFSEKKGTKINPQTIINTFEFTN